MDSRHNLLKSQLVYFLENEEAFIRSQLGSAEMIDQIVGALEDGTVYSIVESLKDLQFLREAELFNTRTTQLSSIEDEEKLRQKTKEVDEKIVETVDEMLKEQQQTLACTGIPLFKVSDEPDEIRLQMAIINFVLSLTNVYNESDSAN